MITGKHLIAGTWRSGPSTFRSEPAFGPAREFGVGSIDLINDAAAAAEEAFEVYGRTSRADRAVFLRAIADEIDARGNEITEICMQETGLPEPRIVGERGRTVSQLRLFAEHVEAGGYLDLRHDPALPDRVPLPRPDLKLVQRPIGPVAVFGASNFPLAFSVAGGDTAAALAAGCPVVVKGHSAHPGTSELVSQAIESAIVASGTHLGVFSLIQGGNRAVGAHLVQHSSICAVGFTGSLAGGRALFDLCAARENPIPFFGELGSVNPMFILPNAARERADAIGRGWANSLTMGAGQFCTNPGVAIMIDGPDAERLQDATRLALSEVVSQTMLTDGIAEAFRQGTEKLSERDSTTKVLGTSCSGRAAAPYLFAMTGDDWLEDDRNQEEVFGPLGIIVKASNMAQVRDIARAIQGQLTCTIHMDTADAEVARMLVPLLERKAGRVLFNGFPTGVEVCDSMVHGGPYPASTNFGATSVGTLSIRRFLRPVCYQDAPDDFVLTA